MARVTEYPRQSPEINPMEHLWYEIKIVVYNKIWTSLNDSSQKNGWEMSKALSKAYRNVCLYEKNLN